MPPKRPTAAARRLLVVRSIKVLHELGSVGLMGGAAAVLVLRMRAPAPPAPGYLALCHAADATYAWLVVPSLLLCIFSGFASMIAHRPYWNALWAWAKGLSGIVAMNFAFRMQSVGISLGEAASMKDPRVLAGLAHTERVGLWVVLVISLLNIVVGIYRPRFERALGASGRDERRDEA